MINIVKYRYLFLGISLLIIIPGMLALLIWGFPLAIDFTGGNLLQLRVDSGNLPQPAQVIEIYNQLGFPDTQVTTSGADIIVIRSKTMDEGTVAEAVKSMENKLGVTLTVQQSDSVGPSVGQEVATRAAGAVGLAALGIMLYITYAFRGVPHAFRYGISAVIAMLHDVLVVIGVEAIFGHFLHWEVDALFLTALLTVIGFSVHDTIVVFDRIRENSILYKRLPYETVVNSSIVQTLVRSINTQLTVMFTLFALAVFGGITIRHFVLILLIGILSGTYSSIFNAPPILVIWENKEWRWWFNPSKRPKDTQATA